MYADKEITQNSQWMIESQSNEIALFTLSDNPSQALTNFANSGHSTPKSCGRICGHGRFLKSTFLM